jgi:hypothetical protein
MKRNLIRHNDADRCHGLQTTTSPLSTAGSALCNAYDQLKKVEVEVGSFAFCWDDLDKEISIPGIFAGRFELPKK